MFGWNGMEESRKAVADRLAKSQALILVGADLMIAPFSDLPGWIPANRPVLEILVGAIALTERNQRQMLTIADLRKSHGARSEAHEGQSFEGVLHDLCVAM